MIHVFSYRDKNYIFDTGSSSLHECDKATADFLRAKEMGEDVDITYITDEQIVEILSDVQGLKDAGLLGKEEVKAYPMKSNEVKALCIHICHDCNFRCRYCFADEGAYHSKRESMSLETAKAAVDFLIANSGKRKVLEMDFFGGEPLMNLGVLKATVAYAKEQGAKAGKKFLFTTTTNALLLDDETIQFFNDEMENVVLSLDGRPEVHDAIRKTVNGKGTYAFIIEKIKKFVRMRGTKSYYVRGTFTAKNLDFSEDVVFLANEGFDSISMEPVVTDLEDLKITEEHLPAIEAEYENLCEKYLDMYRRGEGFNFFHFNIDLEGGPCLSKRVSACGAGNEYFSVLPNGDLYPCHQFASDKEFYMGNVWDGITKPEIREKFKNSCLFTRKKCGDCFAKFICSGGCNANNYHFCLRDDLRDDEEAYRMCYAHLSGEKTAKKRRKLRKKRQKNVRTSVKNLTGK